MTSGPGQYSTDQLGWTASFGMNIKKTGSELSPGSRKNLNHISNIQKPKKNLYGEDEESESNNSDHYFSQFGKENISSSSASSQSFSSNLYGVSTSLSAMNNLGLQQTARSIPNSSSHSGFIGGQAVAPRMVSSSSVGAAPGHVTPTNSMNLPANNSFALSLPSTGVLSSSAVASQQQSSPNRGILGQRQVGAGIVNMSNDLKRPALSIGSGGGLSGNSFSNMSAMGFAMPGHNSRFGSAQNMIGGLPTSMSSAFSTNAAIDLSEFPSLNNRGGRGDSGSTTPNMSSGLMAGRPPYVGMVKQPVSESSEFQIHSEDFPALPGSQGIPDGINSNSNSGDSIQKTAISYNVDNAKENSGRNSSDKSLVAHKRGIHTSSDGIVTNIPGGMVMDQFGMVGLLTFIRAAETDPNLVTLALGSDLTTLGLNLNSPDNLYPSFGGPWAEHSCRPQDVDYHVPLEYLTNLAIRDKLATVKLNRYGEDLLFYIFYTNGGDILQIAAAAELFSRDWRYHKDDQVWITRAPGMTPTEKTSTYERGTYYFFDVLIWRKVAKEFHLEYSKLEDRPHVPQSSKSEMAQFL